MKGMNKEEKEAYLMQYIGWKDDKSDQESDGFHELTEEDMDHPFDEQE